jgi:hypothetical protein
LFLEGTGSDATIMIVGGSSSPELLTRGSISAGVYSERTTVDAVHFVTVYLRDSLTGQTFWESTQSDVCYHLLGLSEYHTGETEAIRRAVLELLDDLAKARSAKIDNSAWLPAPNCHIKTQPIPVTRK